MSNLPGQSGLSSPHNLFQIDQIGSDLSGDAEVDCPVDNVEAEKLKGDVIMLWLIVFPSSDYHDGEDDSAVLVNITSSHAEDPVRGPGRGEGGQGLGAVGRGTHLPFLKSTNLLEADLAFLVMLSPI